LARGIDRIGADVAGLAGAVVVAGEDASVLAGVNDVRVARVGEAHAGLAAADGVPVGQRDAGGREAVAGAGRGPLVLHVAQDAVRDAGIDTGVVELGDRQRR